MDEGIDVMKGYYLAPYSEISGGNYISSKELKKALNPLALQRKKLGNQIEIAHNGYPILQMKNVINYDKTFYTFF